MESVWVDTNVILRFLLKDNEDYYNKSLSLMKKVEEGKVRILISPMIVAESVWTLESYYKISKEDIKEALVSLLCADNVDSEKKDLLIYALEKYAEKNVDFIDAYLATIAQKTNKKIATFNVKHFKRLDTNFYEF